MIEAWSLLRPEVSDEHVKERGPQIRVLGGHIILDFFLISELISFNAQLKYSNYPSFSWLKTLLLLLHPEYVLYILQSSDRAAAPMIP